MKIKWTLVKKISLYFVIIMITAFVLIYLGISGMMRSNNEDTIAADMTETQNNVAAYLEQTIALRSNEIEMFGFNYVMQDVIEEMNLVFGNKFGIYSSEGKVIYSTEHVDDEYIDLEKAIEGYSAYTINYRNNNSDEAIAHCSFPININGIRFIIRMESDYTDLYNNSVYITNIVITGCAVILLGAMALLIMMLVDVASPINKLSVAMRKTAEHPEEVTLIHLNRNDEIGLLADDYNYMATTIKQQMQLIENEKNTLSRTLEYRKAFFDNITHELKTPLTIIIGYAEMIEQTNFEDRDFNVKGIENIIKEGKRLRDMVTELLESTRETTIPDNELKVFDVSKVISDVSGDMDIKAERFGFSVISQCGQGEISGSQNMIRRLMINLIDNAIKYGRAGTKIFVDAEQVNNDYIISITNKLPLDNAKIDTSKIFMPFYRSREDEKKEAGSVGLGLAICKSIVIAHKGTISAKTDDDNIIFKIIIPIYKKGGSA